MSQAFTETAEQQGDLWSAAGKNWAERFAPVFAPVWATSHDLARVTVGTRLLDVGCGSGGALRMAQLRGAEITGLDAAPNLLDIASEHLPDADLRCGDMEYLPYEDDAFDAVTNINGIMYAEDPGRAIREARRVLSPEGRLAMAVWSDPDGCEFRHVMEALQSTLPAVPSGEGPFTLSGPGALEAVMEPEGFDVVETREVSTPFVFADQTHYMDAIHGTGPGQMVSRQIGEDSMTEALLEVGEQFEQNDGSYHLDNTFRIVAAIPTDE